MLDQEQDRANGVVWVLPSDPATQGEYVRIDAAQFDPAQHLEYTGQAAAPVAPKPAAKRKA